MRKSENKENKNQNKGNTESKNCEGVNKRNKCLKTIKHTKRFFAQIINEYNRGLITTEKYRSLVYGLSQYSNLLRKWDIEEDIKKLKDMLEVLNGRSGKN